MHSVSRALSRASRISATGRVSVLSAASTIPSPIPRALTPLCWSPLPSPPSSSLCVSSSSRLSTHSHSLARHAHTHTYFLRFPSNRNSTAYYAPWPRALTQSRRGTLHAIKSHALGAVVTTTTTTDSISRAGPLLASPLLYAISRLRCGLLIAGPGCAASSTLFGQDEGTC